MSARAQARVAEVLAEVERRVLSLLGDMEATKQQVRGVFHAAGAAVDLEPCAEFGEHPKGGHENARRDAERWQKCSACGSRRSSCNDAAACCAECRSTAGLTHVTRTGGQA